MRFQLQENPLATKVILDKDDIDTLYHAVYSERIEECRWAVDFYGIPYEYEQTVDEEVRSLMMHLEGSHNGSCVRIAEECLKCTGERHLGIRSSSYINNPAALWHVKTAMEDNSGDIRKAIEYMEALSKDWDGIKQAIRLCQHHLKDWMTQTTTKAHQSS